MKKVKIALLAAMSFAAPAFAQITNPAPYCAAGYDDAGGMAVPHYITNVTLGTLNNTSGTTQFPGLHYAYYNTVTAPVLNTGSSYTLSVTHDGGFTIHFLAVYVDYNHNNSFTDAGERVLQQALGAVVNPATASITIPAGAVAGTTRMRVVVFEDDMYTLGGSATNATPCTADATGSLDWGETEDYNVTITSASTTLAPIAGFKVNTVSGGTTTAFNFTDTSKHTPTSRKWTFTPATVVYQSGTSDTSANPSVKFTAAGTYSVKLVAGNAAGKDSVTKAGYITVVHTAGIGTLSGDEGTLIYPNPARDIIHLPALTGAQLSMTDVQGRQVLTTIITNDQVSIAHLPAGMYYIRIISDNAIITRMLSIEK